MENQVQILEKVLSELRANLSARFGISLQIFLKECLATRETESGSANGSPMQNPKART